MSERGVFERIGHTLVDLWEWDINVLSEPWMYYPLLIPAMVFMMFVVVKWAIIFCPVWIVPRMIFSGYVKRQAEAKSESV